MTTLRKISNYERFKMAQAEELDGADPPPSAAESLARITNIADYRAAVPTEIPWIVPGMAYAKGITLLSGPPKAGKSTLAAQLQRCRETNDRFLGRYVPKGPTLLVTEEGGIAVVYKTQRLEQLAVLDRHAAADMSWTDVLALLTAWADANADGFVFIDTLSVWAGIEDENDATKVTAALRPILDLAASTDLAVLIVHHSRKSGGRDGEAIRGSGAMLAMVDISMEIRRTSNEISDDRILDIAGRVILPTRIPLAFDRETLTYEETEGTGSFDLVQMEADLDLVPSIGPGLSAKSIQSLWPGRDHRKLIKTYLDKGRLRKSPVQEGRVHRDLFWTIPGVRSRVDQIEHADT